MSSNKDIIQMRELTGRELEAVELAIQTYNYLFTGVKNGHSQSSSLTPLREFITALANINQTEDALIECLTLLNTVCNKAATYGFESINHIIKPEYRELYLKADGLRNAIKKVQDYENRKLQNIRLAMQVIQTLSSLDLSQELVSDPPRDDNAERLLGYTEPINFPIAKKIVGIIVSIIGVESTRFRSLFNAYSEICNKIKSGLLPLGAEGNFDNKTLILAFLLINGITLSHGLLSNNEDQLINHIAQIYKRAKLGIREGITEVPPEVLIPISDVRSEYDMPIVECGSVDEH